jgi:DNA-binding NarL/FixJ family response regulator
MFALELWRMKVKVWRRMCLSEDVGRDQRNDKQRRYRRRIAVMDIDRIKVTPRDQQVLDLLVQGCSNKEIAGQLSISPRTVKQHLRTLFLRAGIREGRKRVRLATAAFEKAEVKI